MPIRHTRNATANDSDKTFTVGTGRTWKLQWISVDLVSTATVGNRQVDIVIGDGTNTILTVNAGAVQAASLTRHYQFYDTAPNETAFVGTNIRNPLPFNMVLLPGWTVRVYDSAAVDAAADDMTVNLVYNERSISEVYT